ncbi:MAG: glycine cleavage T C-terminal barrel domain-containing protein [Ramlibacter sp.]
MNASYHTARNETALLDLAAEGRIRVHGPGAEQALDACFSMDLGIVMPWKGVTGLFLDDDARILAIATVFRGDDEFFVFTEAATAASLLAHLRAQLAGSDAEVEDLSQRFGWLCVLGPKAQNAMSRFAGEEILGLPYLAFEDNAKLDAKLFRMGFCGEYEYRVLCPLERCEAMMAGFRDEGQEFGAQVADPQMLSVLMLEMRSLAMADIPPDADPIQAGLHWMVSFGKEAYRGRDAVHAAKAAPARRALMLHLRKDSGARAGDRIRIQGQDLGFLAQVRFSPRLDRDIALAYADPELGWVGVSFDTGTEAAAGAATGVSAPLFITKTVTGA